MSNVIPNEQFLKGIRLCRRNSKRLLLMADEAYGKKCFHAAFLLGFASLEETGKALIILNHFNDDHITYDVYNKEFKNHEKKIFEALKMMKENIFEVLWIGPRDLLFPNLKVLEPKKQDVRIIKENRRDSIYVDYNFHDKLWKNPIKDMEDLAFDIILKSLEAYNSFLNECKYRKIRLRK